MKIVVGMSGGVDSSVSALLLKQQGFEVIGLFMKNWEETDSSGHCRAALDAEDAASVCGKLNIPFYRINFVKEYRDSVFAQFLADCKAGLTPNPDVLCNREIKFKVFLQKAQELEADLATGHYCRVKEGQLLKGIDPNKDQSYFLHAVSQDALKNVHFPIGHLHKEQVRALARDAGLATSEKKDSTGICFIGERPFKEFLSQFLGYQRGPLMTLDRTVVGEHDGAAYYTIGQRKGIGLGGEGPPWFVVGKDVSNNIVYVERGDHPALYCSELFADSATWIGDPPSLPFSCHAKIRYRQKDTLCTVIAKETGLQVHFQEPQRAVTPGQSVVFYDGDICLGGAIIRA